MERIGQYLGYYSFGTGSIQYILKEMERIAAPLGNQRITDRITAATTAADAAARLDYEWKMHKQAPTMVRAGAAELDNEIDGLITAFYSSCQAHQMGVGPTSDLAGQLITNLFPKGVYPITSPRFEEQHSLVAQLLERLSGPYANHVQQLGLTPIATALAQKHREFGSKLSLLNQNVLKFDDVRAARTEAEDAFHRLVWVAYGELVDDLDILRAVLAPIEDQQRRVSSYLKRRGGRLPQVDSQTGEFVDTDEPTDPVEPTDAPTPA